VGQRDYFARGINMKLGSKGRSFPAVVRFGFVRLAMLRRLQFRGRRFGFGLGGGGFMQRFSGMSLCEFLERRGLIRFHGIGKRWEILVEINVDKGRIDVWFTRDSTSWLCATKTSAATDPSPPVSWHRFDYPSASETFSGGVGWYSVSIARV
jgi:hypothetical protein